MAHFGILVTDRIWQTVFRVWRERDLVGALLSSVC
jgi:hypothetical protein